jgi:hypothetical protein
MENVNVPGIIVLMLEEIISKVLKFNKIYLECNAFYLISLRTF